MISLLLTSVVLVVTELIYFRLADLWNIIDKPNERSSHTHMTLRGGGIIFPIAAVFFFAMSSFTYTWFILGLIIISVISFWDDMKPLSTTVRLVTHLLAVLFMFHQLGLFSESILLILILLILCVGIINAYNFMDGINGITGGYSFVILGSLAWVNHFYVSFVVPELLGMILVSLLVFNFFNFRTKAKCFAGDVGSVSIAYITLFVLGILMLKTQDPSWICFLVVYGVDSVLTIIHRILLKENITKPHRKHLYQLLVNELKLSHVLVALIYALVQLIIIICYLLCRLWGAWVVWSYIGIVIFLLVCLYCMAIRKWFHLHPLS